MEREEGGQGPRSLGRTGDEWAWNSEGTWAPPQQVGVAWARPRQLLNMWKLVRCGHTLGAPV